MANVLYLVHRMPYPPNKGDKVRSYHLLKHLQQNHRVFLGTFIDDPEDEQHLAALKALCPDLCVLPLNPRWGKLKSLTGLLTGEALTLAYYRHPAMAAWVRQVVAEHSVQASVVFSSAMAPYAQALLPQVPMLVDLVDVDSAKWVQYAPNHRWPLSWLYRREGRTLLAFETQAALQSRRTFLVTPNETALFQQLAPQAAHTVESLSNGVDADFFAPNPRLPNPYQPGEQAVVFTGAMDYWPNVDAVQWFAQDMLPALRQRWPGLRFVIVGRNPTPAVQALASGAVTVTGTVPDVRPYLQHAAAVVAPLRVARGLQNKILEAMAMGQPVVTVPGCAEAIGAQPHEGVVQADTPQGYVQALAPWLDQPTQRATLGEQARAYVLAHYSWQAHLAGLDAHLEPLLNPVLSAHQPTLTPA